VEDHLENKTLISQENQKREQLELQRQQQEIERKQ